MRTRPLLIAVMFALGSVPLFPGLEWAQQTTNRYVVMTWSFKTTPPDIVYLQLYGQDNKVWPAPDKYYKLDGRAARKTKITCALGEQICYGAWTDSNKSWGVGKNNYKRGDCKDCCVPCSKGHKGTETLKP